MDICGISDRGKVRPINQDVCQTWYDKACDIALLVVCDGMGGAKAGNVASALAADFFMESMKSSLKDDMNIVDIMQAMQDAVKGANRCVFDRGSHDTDCSGMGTTLVAATVARSGTVIANVGDSRAYHATGVKFAQVTKDHSVVEDMIDRGDLTRTEANMHPNKNLITRALGTAPEVEPDFFFLNLVQGDYLLLCSDGLTNVVNEDLIYSELKVCSSVQESAQRLMMMAIAQGAPDNVTVVLCRK